MVFDLAVLFAWMGDGLTGIAAAVATGFVAFAGFVAFDDFETLADWVLLLF